MKLLVLPPEETFSENCLFDKNRRKRKTSLNDSKRIEMKSGEKREEEVHVKEQERKLASNDCFFHISREILKKNVIKRKSKKNERKCLRRGSS